MRIVAGKARGRRLQVPRDRNIRPTTDRVREALFSSLNSRMTLAGTRVLDLFAGTGALAFEALSRGAANAVLVDHDPAACQLIEQNRTALGFAGQVVLRQQEAESALTALARDLETFDIILADPPYQHDIHGLIKLATLADVLAEDGLLVVEHLRKRSLPALCGRLCQQKTNTYGQTAVTLYARRQSEEERRGKTRDLSRVL